MGNAAAPAAHRFSGVTTIVTTSIDRASRHLAGIFGDSARVDYHAERRPFMMKYQAAAVGEVILTRAETLNCDTTRETGTFVNITVPLEGRLVFHSGRSVNEILPSRNAGVGRPQETIRFELDKGRGMALTAPLPALVERAERLTGTAFNSRSMAQFVETVDLASPLGAALTRTMKSAMVEIASLESIGLGRLATAGYEELLLNLSVAALFPALAPSFAAAPADCGPAVIRRAREYIHAHASEPIEVSRLAADLGISMRAMQENFQRYLGFSPRDYILECRLDNARQLLLAPAAGFSVTYAAFACGFTDLGHFSAKYRDKYGELPSATLRAARREAF